jgi:hypothetical protein
MIPLPSRWQRNALPLSYTRLLLGRVAPTRTGIGWIKTICPYQLNDDPTLNLERVSELSLCSIAASAL